MDLKSMIAVVLATAILSALSGAASGSYTDMISPLGTTLIAGTLGAFCGMLIAVVAWLIRRMMR